MKTIYNNSLLIAIIFLPVLICILLYNFLEIDIGYRVLYFGLIIMLFNYNKAKYNLITSNVLSIILSYMTFLISVGLYFGIGYIIMQFVNLDKLDNIYVYGFNTKKILMLLPITIFSPLLMFYSYLFLFKINKEIFKKVRFITILILLILGFLELNFESKNLSMLWQVIMVLALQLILYEKDIKALFKTKNV